MSEIGKEHGQWVAVLSTTRVWMNINSLLRELSGPRTLCRGVGIVSKPRLGLFTRNPANLPNYMGAAGRMANPPNSTPPHASVTPTLDSPVSLVYAMQKFPNIEQYMFSYIPSPGDGHPVTLSIDSGTKLKGSRRHPHSLYCVSALIFWKMSQKAY